MVRGPSGSFLKSYLWTTPCRTQCAQNTIKCWNRFSVVKVHLNCNLTYAGDVGGLAYPRRCETFSDFPSKNSRIFPFALDDRGDDTGGEQSGAAPTDGLGFQESCAPVAAQDLTDAPVGHLKMQVSSTVLNKNNPLMLHLT